MRYIQHVWQETSAWKTWMLLSAPPILVGLLAVIYYPTFDWFWLRWFRDESYYSHGVLIPVITGFLIWRERNRIRQTPLQMDNFGLLILVAGLFIQLFSAWTRIHFISGFSLLIVLTGLIWYLFGRGLTRVIWFPLFFLVFMVPMPLDLISKLTLQLKLVAASLGSSLVNLLGTPNFREGSIIYLPNTTVTVDAPCSGLKSLITFLAMGSLYAYIVNHAPLRRWILVLLCVPIAIFANLVRVVLILIISNRFGNSIITDDFLHKGFGLLVFVVGLICFFLVAKLLKLELPIVDSDPDSEGGNKKGESSDEGLVRDTDNTPLPVLGRSFGITVLLLGIVALTTYGAFEEIMESDFRYTYQFPNVIGEWHVVRDWFAHNPGAERVYNILETRDTIQWEYQDSDGNLVDLVIVYSPHNRKVSHPPDICFQGGGWQQQVKNTLPAPYGHAYGLAKVNRLVLDRAGKKQIALYWYKSGSQQTSSYLKQQTGYLLNSALRRKSRSVALIRLTAYADTAMQVESKTRQLESFAEQVVPSVDRVIP
ncbi:MAG: EpsI family protein [Candidatus Poribacteria bacterium]|nr:EpsI family protein [Candidatus Poribacteria bacterium]